MDSKHYLFSYGTLQLEKVQIETYGRKLLGVKDSLIGYRLDNIKIIDTGVVKTSGKNFHPIARKTASPNDRIDGIIYEITEEELRATDKYEVSDYQRVLENFTSNRKAWIYIAKEDKPFLQ